MPTIDNVPCENFGCALFRVLNGSISNPQLSDVQCVGNL